MSDMTKRKLEGGGIILATLAAVAAMLLPMAFALS